MHTGKLILIEGPDGAGKTTQVELLQRHLNQLGIRTRYIHFPVYDSPTGQVILEMLKGDTMLLDREAYRNFTRFLVPTRLWEERMTDIDKNRHAQHAQMLQALFAINRYEVMDEVQAALDDGVVVLMDRYFPSSYAYGQATGVDLKWLYAINSCQILPDLAVYLHVSPEVTAARRPEHRDRFEADRDLQHRVDRYYQRYFGEMFDAGREFYVVRGDRSVEEVHDEILRRWSTLCDQAATPAG